MIRNPLPASTLFPMPSPLHTPSSARQMVHPKPRTENSFIPQLLAQAFDIYPGTADSQHLLSLLWVAEALFKEKA